MRKTKIATYAVAMALAAATMMGISTENDICRRGGTNCCHRYRCNGRNTGNRGDN